MIVASPPDGPYPHACECGQEGRGCNLTGSALYATISHMKDKSTSFRLSPEAKRLLKKLSQRLGISQVAVLEIIIRDKAKVENIE